MATTNMSKPSTKVSVTNMSKPSSPVTSSSSSTVGKNISSLSTSAIQKAVGAKSDGIYGSQTTEAVKAFQKSKGLVADGIVGPKTEAAIKASMVGGSSSSSPVISNQSNIVKSTDTLRNMNNQTANKLDSIAGGNKTAVFGGKYIYNIDEKGNPYGAPLGTTEDTPFMEKTQKEDKTQINEPTIEDGKGNKYFSEMPEEMSYQLPELQNDKRWVFDKSGKAYEMDAGGKISRNTAAEQMYNENLQQKKMEQEYNQLWDDRKADLDSRHVELIDRIKQEASRQKTQMKDLNERYLGSKKVAGFRTGATEYTPEIAMGILKNEEEQGLARINDIELKANLLISEALVAKDEKDFELAKQKLDMYSKLQTEKKKAIQDIYKAYIDNQKYIMDTKKALDAEDRAKTDQAIQELKVKAPQLSKDYQSAKDKNKYIESLISSTGLDRETILGAITSATPKEKTAQKSTSPKTINYSSATIPADIKDSILDDIKNDGSLTLQELYDAYPEVQSTYLKSIWDSLKKKSTGSSGKKS